jgi:hypothetical protein
MNFFQHLALTTFPPLHAWFGSFCSSHVMENFIECFSSLTRLTLLLHSLFFNVNSEINDFLDMKRVSNENDVKLYKLHEVSKTVRLVLCTPL